MPKVSPNILKSFSSLLEGREGLPYDEFINWALYDPKIGYYRSSKKRVGKDSENDFYTSTSLGSIWGELIVEASVRLLGKRNPSQFVFIEIGAEPNTSILDSVTHPFAESQTIRIGDKFEIAKQAIVYSNEWLDAQPFKRFKYSSKLGCWLEILVGLKNSQLVEFEKKPPNCLDIPLPEEAQGGYTIDWPSGSVSSLKDLITNNAWSGIFITFDYGLDINTLLKERPEGTARAYSKHKVLNSLLNNPGGQDLTCHLCWDSLINCLELANFEKINLASQESFLMHNCRGLIEEIFKETSDTLNPKMLALKELLHPAHLGHGIQVLSAERNECL